MSPTPCNIVNVIRAETAGCLDRTAVIDGPVVLTYRQLLAAVDEMDAALRVRGIRPLDRIAFLCEDNAAHIVASLAILQRGGVVVPVSPSLMGDELTDILDRMDVHALLAEESAARSREGTRLEIASAPGARFFLTRRAARDATPPDYALLNPAFIRFSSGTTGASKGVLLSHRTLVDRTDTADQGLRITPDDTILWVLSMSFHFVVSILLYLRRGATILICCRPFPEAFLDAVRGRRGTLLYASPLHYHVLVHSPLVPPDALAGVRLAVSTAMKLPESAAAAFQKKFGRELVEAYGIIEVGLPFINNAAGRARPGCVGAPLPGCEVRIAAPDAEGVGGIELRARGIFDAYVSPWKRREDLMPDGWFRTGDVGRLDTDGYLYILGREKIVINFSGMKIFPYEVEAALSAHPAVSESLVYGEPHPLYGQIPMARVVLKPGIPEPADLRRHCQDRLAPHKVPMGFQFVADLPRTESGKIRRA